MALPSPALAATRPDPTWSAVQRFMLKTCGVVLADDQVYLLEARLASVAREKGFRQVSDFVAAACAGSVVSPAAVALIDAMTTHETLFFRDAGFWRCLEEQLLAKLEIKARGGAAVKIWSAACSTGQEPYTLSMLIAERFPALASKVEIVATDVSEVAVAKGQKGVYSALEVNRGLSAVRLVKHFESAAGSFRVRDTLRDRITWSVHNLLGGRPDPTGCDLVLCRNVLIYFGETDRGSVIRRLFAACGPTGVVGVGSTEVLRATQIATGLYSR